MPSCNGNGAIPNNSLTLSDPTQYDRLTRDGVPSTCSGKTCYGPYYPGPYNYKSFKFTNPSTTARCVTVTVNAACGASTEIESVAYLGSTYDPPAASGDGKVCKNYVADSGIGGLGSYTSTVDYSFNVPAQSDFVVVFNTTYPGTTCTQFSAVISGRFK